MFQGTLFFNRLRITEYRLQSTDYRVQITDYRVQRTDYRLQMNDDTEGRDAACSVRFVCCCRMLLKAKLIVCLLFCVFRTQHAASLHANMPTCSHALFLFSLIWGLPLTLSSETWQVLSEYTFTLTIVYFYHFIFVDICWKIVESVSWVLLLASGLQNKLL